MSTPTPAQQRPIRLAGLSRAIRDAYHAHWCGPKCKPPCEGAIEPGALIAVRKAVVDFLRAAERREEER